MTTEVISIWPEEPDPGALMSSRLSDYGLDGNMVNKLIQYHQWGLRDVVSETHE